MYVVLDILYDKLSNGRVKFKVPEEIFKTEKLQEAKDFIDEKIENDVNEICLALSGDGDEGGYNNVFGNSKTLYEKVINFFIKIDDYFEAEQDITELYELEW